MAESFLIKELLKTIPQKGMVVSITVRPERRTMPEFQQKVQAIQGKGLSGDHFNSKRNKREVTLIQAEHFDVVGAILGKEIDHRLTRRNIAVKGINLLSLKGQRFRIGEAILEGTGECHPCTRMEENFGPGGYNAMRGHGGLTAAIIEGGEIKIGDTVELLP